MHTMRSKFAVSAVSVFALGVLGAGIQAGQASAQQEITKTGRVVVPILTSKGEDAGKATFKESKDGKELTISLKLKNLPFGEHAVHIHANPVCDAPDFKGAGGHLNPDMKQHGMDNPMGTMRAICRRISRSARTARAKLRTRWIT